MTSPLVLDSGPLGRLTHPRTSPELANWLDSMLAAGHIVILPEIADYEVRRSLLLGGLAASLGRLDRFKQVLDYLPITTSVMLKAAELWADVRRRGQPTADPKELDGDVILAAQALEVGGIVVTENVGHLTRFVEAKTWRDISVLP